MRKSSPMTNEIAKVLNDLFSNIIESLNISQKNHTDSITENVRDPTLKAILKYRKHPSTLEIKRKIKSGPVFTFNHITKEDVIKEMKNLDASKASEEDDIPTKIIKENSDIFSSFIYQSFNNMTDVWISPTPLKLANITPVYKKVSKNLQASKYLARCKGVFLSQYQIILKIYFQNFSVVLGKVSVHNIA